MFLLGYAITFFTWLLNLMHLPSVIDWSQTIATVFCTGPFLRFFDKRVSVKLVKTAEIKNPPLGGIFLWAKTRLRYREKKPLLP